MPDKKEIKNISAEPINTELDTQNIENNQVKENPEAVIARLIDENTRLRKIVENSHNENQILRATVKALTQLI